MQESSQTIARVFQVQQDFALLIGELQRLIAAQRQAATVAEWERLLDGKARLIDALTAMQPDRLFTLSQEIAMRWERHPATQADGAQLLALIARNRQRCIAVLEEEQRAVTALSGEVEQQRRALSRAQHQHTACRTYRPDAADLPNARFLNGMQ